MPLQIVPFAEQHVPAVKAFNRRMADRNAASDFLLPTQPVSTLPRNGSVITWTHFVVIDLIVFANTAIIWQIKDLKTDKRVKSSLNHLSQMKRKVGEIRQILDVLPSIETEADQMRNEIQDALNKIEELRPR